MKKETIITTAGLAAPHPGRLGNQGQVCMKCAHIHIDNTDTLALGDGVGWCPVFCQYRSLKIERLCDLFTENGG